ncbi:MAG: UDP-N-acetylmuramoyl-L-alanyl-D-glutamate--2,6-diaminopimelate ligase, partial [Muribaculaceae bacterium]|nr:UDP-N-acetylmuramoyl-L-alanyl-D-glutamate--2,6-diaminopimelate ligase [Muribaculaceae bacterium]
MNPLHTTEALLRAIEPTEVKGSVTGTLTGITADSRAVVPGGMFVAVHGFNVDGHSFIPAAIAAGAAAVVCEEIPAGADNAVTWIRTADSAEALGRLASAWYGYPSRRLTLVGVTGTNGKTTIATLLYEMARLSGHKAGLLSTVVNYIDTRAVAARQTTPDALTITRLLPEMVEAGCEYAAMEVSSHAAHQQRIAGLTFAGAIFTNLTRD